jgi:hypothetical protein
MIFDLYTRKNHKTAFYARWRMANVVDVNKTATADTEGSRQQVRMISTSAI